MRKEIFTPGEYYHVYSRVILNITEFKNYENAQKLHQAFLLANSTESSTAFRYLRNYENAGLGRAIEIAWRGEKLVDVVAYVIMPNHYHLLVKELRENGISDFFHKCNTAIAKYINIKEERKGPLFESNFKAKHIDSNQYLLHLSLYIHLNPLDFIDSKNWRNGNLKNWNSKKKELLEYPWSSLKNYLYKDYEDWILSGTEIILDQFKDKKDYEKFLREWSGANFEEIKEIL